MSNPVGAIITGGDFQGLGALRTLGRKGVPVIVLDSDLCIARFSKFTTKCIKAPSTQKHEKYVDFLLDLARREEVEGWVILPNSDEAVYILARYRDLLETIYRVSTPPWDVIKYLYIKRNTYELAESHGIPTPKTFYPDNLQELMALNLQFPVVIKPSVRDNFYNKVKVKAFRITSRQELEEVYTHVTSVIDPSEVIVQEFIPGGPNHLYSYCPFFKDGKVVTGVAARRARQHPMDFGHASTYAETVDIPELRELAEKFLGLVGYYGIGEVEFMYHVAEKSYKLIEVNPRIWGWHTLAIAAGVDLPYLLFQDMLGNPVEVPAASNHAKWVRLATDIPTVLTEIIKGNMRFGDYVSSMKGKKEFACFSMDDPLPFFAELALIPYLWKKRGF